MSMSRAQRIALWLPFWVTLAVADSFAQSPPAPSMAKRAVDERKAIYTLIGASFRPIGEQLQGRTSLSAPEARKRAERLAFLASLSADAYADTSNVGAPSTRAGAEIWAHRAEFDQLVDRFVIHTRKLSEVAASEAASSDAFKSAAAAVAEDCKACHDKYRSK